MKEIVERLQENRNIERAKSILESNGYKVSKTLQESSTQEEYMEDVAHLSDLIEDLSRNSEDEETVAELRLAAKVLGADPKDILYCDTEGYGSEAYRALSKTFKSGKDVSNEFKEVFDGKGTANLGTLNGGDKALATGSWGMYCLYWIPSAKNESNSKNDLIDAFLDSVDNPNYFYRETLDKDITVDECYFISNTWDDGAPVLKYFNRDPETLKGIKLSRGTEVLICYDRINPCFYFPINGGWCKAKIEYVDPTYYDDFD